MKYKVNFIGQFGIEVDVLAEDIDGAKQLAKYRVENLFLQNKLKHYNVKDIEIKLLNPLYLHSTKMEIVGIMDTTNSHNKELVDRINVAWDTNKNRFKHILLALMKRDIEEMVDKNCFGEAMAVTETYEELYAKCEKDWEVFAEPYLMRVADDNDLEVILQFVE